VKYQILNYYQELPILFTPNYFMKVTKNFV